MFSIVAEPVYIPTKNAPGSLFSISSQCSPSFFFLMTNNTNRCEVVLICISPVTNDVEHRYVYLLGICMSSLERCLFRFSAYFCQILIFFLAIELHEFFFFFFLLSIYFGTPA